MKEKQRKGGKKGAVKDNLRRRQRIPLAGVCFRSEAEPSGTRLLLRVRTPCALCSEREEEKRWNSALHGSSEAAGGKLPCATEEERRRGPQLRAQNQEKEGEKTGRRVEGLVTMFSERRY